MNTEGSPGLGDLLEGQALVVELIARGESLYQVLDTLLRIIQLQCPCVDPLARSRWYSRPARRGT